ncbi:MAG: hypothetical protein ACFFAU_15670 [Candidatus Hodarchaeota archaeon]
MNSPRKDKQKDEKTKKTQLLCKNCGKKLLYIARYCPLCGVDLSSLK